MAITGGSSAADQANHFPLGSIAGYMSRFFGDDLGQQQPQQHHSLQPKAPPVEENLVEDTNDSSGDGGGGGSSSRNSGIGSNSHEVSRFSEKKQWKPLSFSENEPPIRKRHRAVLVGGKLGHEELEEEEEVSKDDFLADWSHELATKWGKIELQQIVINSKF